MPLIVLSSEDIGKLRAAYARLFPGVQIAAHDLSDEVETMAADFALLVPNEPKTAAAKAALAVNRSSASGEGKAQLDVGSQLAAALARVLAGQDPFP